jgi:hypothetical protein
MISISCSWDTPETEKKDADAVVFRKSQTYQVLICQGPKLTLSKLRRAEAVVGGTAGGGTVSRSWA